MMHRAYRCLACGRDILIIERQDNDAPAEFVTWTIEVGHRGPIDAACRLVLETLGDALRVDLNARLDRSVETLRGMLG